MTCNIYRVNFILQTVKTDKFNRKLIEIVLIGPNAEYCSKTFFVDQLFDLILQIADFCGERAVMPFLCREVWFSSKLSYHSTTSWAVESLFLGFLKENLFYFL